MSKLLLLPVMLFVVTSCKKITSSNPSGTITADIDGTATSFNTDVIGLQPDAYGTYQISFSGFQGTAGSSSQISIAISGSAPITVGTYDDVSTTAPDVVALVYAQQPGSGEYGIRGVSPDTVSVTITSISATEIQGTFVGGVVLTSGSTTPGSHTITNGKFEVPII